MRTALKKSKERFETEMAELGSPREMSARESDLAGRISGLERKIQYVNADKVLVCCGAAMMWQTVRSDSCLNIRCSHAELRLLGLSKVLVVSLG
jgi:hypothetical protein